MRPIVLTWSLVLVAGAATPQSAPPPAPAPAKSESPPASAPRTSLVLVTLDTLRADHLSCYGWFRKTSPFIDSLADESLLFERCYSVIPHTTPSHASILTGVTPLEHGITENSFRAPEDVKRSRALVTTPQLQTYAQIAKKHGYVTAAFVSSITTARVYGLDAGFDTWTQPEGEDEMAEMRPGRETIADAKKWIATIDGRPFFLWEHLFDVHGRSRKGDERYADEHKYADDFPNDAALREELSKRGVPETMPGRHGNEVRPPVQNSLYDARIRATDDLVAELVAALKRAGVWDTSAFVLTADHGEGLGEHDFLGHELTWNEQIRVPLIVHVPGRPPERLDQLVSGIDVLPTVVDLCPGLPRDELLAQCSGVRAASPSFEERPVFSVAAAEKEYSLTSRRWKLVRRADKSEQLYDLKEDPLELHDVKSANEQNQKTAAQLAALLDIKLAEQEKRRAYLKEGGIEPKLTPEEEERQRKALKSLGYGGN